MIVIPEGYVLLEACEIDVVREQSVSLYYPGKGKRIGFPRSLIKTERNSGYDVQLYEGQVIDLMVPDYLARRFGL